MHEPRDVVEDLVFECLERQADVGSSAVDELLAQHPDPVQRQVRETLALLQRVGLTGEPPAGEPPGTFGPYLLLERLGSGAMGVVYRARAADGLRSGDLAIKLMQPGLLPVRGNRLRFEREIRALRELDHPGICPIVDDGEIDGVPFLVMPHVAGVCLREILAAGAVTGDGRNRLLAVLQQVAQALHHAHERGFVHRDVKPGNVIVAADGRAVLLDFGLARLDRPDGGGTLTTSGGIVGTPAYMGPELVAGRADVDRRCDVYALGVMLYEGLTGRLPHEAPTRESLYRRILSSDVVVPSRHVHGLPRAFDAVCMMALARDPARRYQTALLFADDVAHLLAGEPVAARLPGPLQRVAGWAHRYPAASVLLLLLALATATLLALARALHAAATGDRARLMAIEAHRLAEQQPAQALALALAAHDLAAVPESLVAIQSALAADHDAFAMASTGSPISAFVFSSDDRWLCARTEDGRARVFELGPSPSPREVPLGAAGIGVTAVAFQPATSLLAIGGGDGVLTAINLGQAATVFRQQALPVGSAITSLAYSPDGSRILCASSRSVRLLAADGQHVGNGLDDRDVLHAAWTSDRRFVLTESRADRDGRGQVALFDAAAPVPSVLRTMSFALPVALLRCNPSPTRRDLLLVAAAGRTAWICDVATGSRTEVRAARDFGNDITAAGWTHDGEHLFLVARGGRCEFFNAAGVHVESNDSLDNVTVGVASPAQSQVAVLGNIGTVQIISLDGPAVRSLGRRRLRNGALGFSHDGMLLATSTWTHEIVVWRLFDPDLPAFYSGGQVRSVDWTDGGRTILQGNRMVGRRRGAMHSWSLATGRQVHAAMVYPDLPVVTMAMNASRDRAVAVHVSDSRVTVRLFAREGTAWRDVATLPEGQFREFCVAAEFLSPQLLLLCDTAGAVVLWDTAAGTFTRLPEGTMQSSSPIDHRRWMACTGLPDASSIWAGGAPGYVHRFDRRADGSFAVAEPVRFGDAIQVLHLLPDGSLMVGGMNGLLERLCVDGRRVRFGRHRTRVACIVSALLDGEVLLASGDQDGVICLWRDDGRLERAIEQTGGAVFALQFSPDAEQLLSGTRNGITRAWPVRTSRLLEIADRRRR